AGANVPSIRASPAALTNPMQFGPTSLIPDDRQTPSNSSCAAFPSAPVSANPAEITHRARTPAAAHCRAASGTAQAGTATTASSAVSGNSLTLAEARPPATDFADGLIG